jgi:hypothetical protein
MNSLKKIAFVFGSIVVIIAVTAGFSASSPPAGSFRSFEFTYPSLPAGSKVSRIWIPLLQSDRYQTIGDLKIESPFPYAHHRDPGYGNEYLYLQGPVDKVTAAAEVRITFQATRREHRVELDAPVTAPSLPPQRRAICSRDQHVQLRRKHDHGPS